MNEITLRIRYKAQSKPVVVSIQVQEESSTKEEIARLFAVKLTQDYSKYLGGKKNQKELKRYEFGQYKLILHLLETKL
jgi:hypothetical protein